MAIKSKSNFGKRELTTLLGVLVILGGFSGVLITQLNQSAGASYVGLDKLRPQSTPYAEPNWYKHADSTLFSTKDLADRKTYKGLRFFATVGNNGNSSNDPHSERGTMSLYLTPDFFSPLGVKKYNSVTSAFTYLDTAGTYISSNLLDQKSVSFKFSDEVNILSISTDKAFLNGQPAFLTADVYYNHFAYGPLVSGDPIPQILTIQKVALSVRYINNNPNKNNYAMVEYLQSGANSGSGAFFMPENSMLAINAISLPGFPNPYLSTLTPAPSSSPTATPNTHDKLRRFCFLIFGKCL